MKGSTIFKEFIKKAWWSSDGELMADCIKGLAGCLKLWCSEKFENLSKQIDDREKRLKIAQSGAISDDIGPTEENAQK